MSNLPHFHVDKIGLRTADSDRALYSASPSLHETWARRCSSQGVWMTDLGPILSRLGLDQYHDVLVQEGFDTWDVVLDIQESDL